MADPDGESTQALLDDVQRRMSEHPGYREYVACAELARTINTVFVPNLRELHTLLLLPTRDANLAIELFQNMKRPDVRDGYESAVTQRLHNYVAGSATLVDHARRLMRLRSGPVAEDFHKRKTAVVENPEVPFIKDLRNFVLHRTHPFLAHTVKIEDGGGIARGEIELSTADLLSWSGWTSAARAFVKSRAPAIELRPVVRRHGDLMIELHNWLHDELATANTSALEDANRLVVERNAILGGLDTAAAERLTEAVTKRRESPLAITSDDLPEAFGLRPSAPDN